MATPELLAEMKAYVTPGATNVSSADDAFIASCLETAIALVDNRCGTAKDKVPLAVLHRAYIEAGSELFNRRAAPNGISQYAASDGSAIRVARDPMVAAEPILSPYLGLGFA